MLQALEAIHKLRLWIFFGHLLPFIDSFYLIYKSWHFSEYLVPNDLQFLTDLFL